MKNKKIGLIMYVIGLIIYMIFLVLITKEFGSKALVYSFLSSLGVVLFINGIRLICRRY